MLSASTDGQREKVRKKASKATNNKIVLYATVRVNLSAVDLVPSSIVMYSLAMSAQKSLTVLVLGDVIGSPGRRMVAQYLAALDPKPDLVIANAENAAHGFGITEKNLNELRQAGVAVFSGGNHTFDQKEIFTFIDREEYLLRPANYPEGTPGRGSCIYAVAGVKVAVLNVMGRIFMEPLDSPFAVADRLVGDLSKETNLIVVDIHAEATSEKVAMGWYLDGRVSAVLGTHTHVQTADERVLPGGTAYITDMGSCGPADGVIGMDRATVFRRLIQQLPSRFDVAAGPAMVNGVKVELDTSSGKALSIERVRVIGEVKSPAED